MRVAVCVSFADQRPEVDPLTGEVSTDERSSRLTDADAAAVELALRCAERWRGAAAAPITIVAITVGPPAAEAVLREALACGVDRAVRVDQHGAGAAATAATAADVAVALAAVLGDVDLVWCGDQGVEAGSGAVPVLLAAELGSAGAFGLVAAEPGDEPGTVAAVRRLDGGRRERLAVTGPAVLSVEGAVARLRRAGLPGLLRADRAAVEVVPAPPPALSGVRVGLPRPYRPRPRVVPAPQGAAALDRVRALTGAGVAAAAATGPHDRRAPVVVDPAEAATLILEALDRWGYALAERATP